MFAVPGEKKEGRRVKRKERGDCAKTERSGKHAGRRGAPIGQDADPWVCEHGGQRLIPGGARDEGAFEAALLSLRAGVEHQPRFERRFELH